MALLKDVEGDKLVRAMLELVCEEQENTIANTNTARTSRIFKVVRIMDTTADSFTPAQFNAAKGGINASNTVYKL